MGSFKSTGKKTTVTEELSKRVDSTPVPKKKSGGASNIISGTQKVGGKQPEQSDSQGKEPCLSRSIKDLNKRVEKRN